MTASIDRALAALQTQPGENRVRPHLASASAIGDGKSVGIEDLVEALRELRRRSEH